MFSKQVYTYKKVNPSFSGRTPREYIIDGAFWVLMEISRMTIISAGIFFIFTLSGVVPWIHGHMYTEGSKMTYMNYKGWAVKSFSNGNKYWYIGVPDVVVIVIHHLCFALFYPQV